MLVVSVDGLAPRHVTRERMPALTAFAREGAACWHARTVFPSWTLPAHISMVRGVDPSVHRVMDNTPVPPAGSAPSFLRVLRQAGLRTAVVHSWSNMDVVFEGDCAHSYVLLDDGYDPAIDHAVNAEVARLAPRHDVIFAYHVTPDLCGHDHGWDSPEYLAAVATADAKFAALLDAVGSEWTVLVTTDHGGLGRNHGGDEPEVMETFVAARGRAFAPGSMWSEASILDVAPTAVALCGVEGADEWSGRSLVGQEQPTVDWLMGQLASMADHTYGEAVTMLEHALQTAANAAADGADTAQQLAALLHDVGHLSDNAGAWGLPDHAAVGARMLQQVLPTTVTEPIRLHVAAKRWLVARDAEYMDALSHASQVTLQQQGGPFTEAEAEAFDGEPFAAAGVQLRRWDDQGKVEDREPLTLADWRPLLAEMLAPPAETVDPRWARDACRCAECRDPGNDQHLIDVNALAGWRVVSQTRAEDRLVVDLVDGEGARHRCEIPDAGITADARVTWGSPHQRVLLDQSIDWTADRMDAVAAQVALAGVSLLRGVPVESGEVLQVAAALGHVRATNYGTMFDVVSTPDPNNLAYSSLGLPLHTDNPYRDPCPTVQLLHCLMPASEGGATQISDGFRAAEVLRDEQPAMFEVLAQTMLTFRFHDAEVDLQARRSMIEVDGEGTIRAVNVNHRSMEAPPAGPGASRFYEAYARFQSLLNAEDAIVEFFMAAGDLLVFDNRRVLHARTAFGGTNQRHLQGCYIDMDAIRSTARRAVGA